MTDVLLSALHFLLAFSLVGILAVQYVLIRPGLRAEGAVLLLIPFLATAMARGYGL